MLKTLHNSSWSKKPIFGSKVTLRLKAILEILGMLNCLVILTSFFSGHIKDKRNIYILKKHLFLLEKKCDRDMIQQYYA